MHGRCYSPSVLAFMGTLSIFGAVASALASSGPQQYVAAEGRVSGDRVGGTAGAAARGATALAVVSRGAGAVVRRGWTAGMMERIVARSAATPWKHECGIRDRRGRALDGRHRADRIPG